MLIDILGSSIHYETVGDGPVVVFLHGLGSTSNVWHAQRVALQKTHRVIMLDLPGSGRSSKHERSYSMTRWAEQLDAFAAQVQLPPFVLVGHSMTTILAQNFAARYPQRLRGVVLCGPLTEQPPAMKDAFTKRAEAVLREGMGTVADQVLAGAISAGTRESALALAGLYREMLLANDPPSYAAQCHALIAASAKEDQPKIRCPMLILVGDQDGVTPIANCRAIATAVANARIRVIPSTAHLTMAERPEAFNAALLDFLAELPA
jgi:pimeloyl-ACP methyl ester carboxylesterase